VDGRTKCGHDGEVTHCAKPSSRENEEASEAQGAKDDAIRAAFPRSEAYQLTAMYFASMKAMRP
jgi:hypothetical protein